MKSYNGLFNRMIEIDEIKKSINEAAKGKKNKRHRVSQVLENIDDYSVKLQELIMSGNWNPPTHNETILQEGYHKKARNIQKPQWDNEQIVHHMLMRQYIPIVQPKIHIYCCGSIPGRGTHYIANAMWSWVKQYGNNKFYVAELDIKKFYDNVNIDILKKQLSPMIRDTKYKNLLFKVLGDKKYGLPKGFYTSPWMAHTYLLPMDNYILQFLKPDHYARYMDNLYLFSTNKRKLRRMVEWLKAFIWCYLGLEFNDSWQVYRFEDAKEKICKDGKMRLHGRPINALGFVIHRNRISIRKGILKRIRAKANRVHKRKTYTILDCRSIISRLGYFKHSDTYGYFTKYIKPKVNIRAMKQRIRVHDRKLAKGGITV